MNTIRTNKSRTNLGNETVLFLVSTNEQAIVVPRIIRAKSIFQTNKNNLGTIAWTRSKRIELILWSANIVKL